MTSRTRPNAVFRLVAASAFVLFGLSVSINAAGTIITLGIVGVLYAILLIAVARAARERRHGAALALTALVMGGISTLLVPATWGVSLFIAALVLPLALPGLTTPGGGRWLAMLALLLNATLTVLLALTWFV